MKQAKLQLLQNPSKVNGDNLNNINTELLELSGTKISETQTQA
jgi:hypothetical protein